MSEIKHCPFCGHRDIQVHDGSTFRWLVAICCGCGAQSPEARIDTLADDREKAIADASLKAIEEWNTRA